MNFIRIGEKLISKSKIERTIDEILEYRVMGYTQEEVAQKLKLDRTFVSRLERIGEVRKGKKIAVIGFPVLNKEEILAVCREESIDFALIMSEEERWDFLQKKSGLELFNELMELIGQVRNYDTVILLTSDKRAKLVGELLQGEVLQINLGQSPLAEDRYVAPEELRELILTAKGGQYEKSC